MSIDLATIRRSRASRAAFAILDAIQYEDSDHIAAGLGLCFFALCEEKGLNPSDIMAAAAKMLRATGLEDDNYVTALKTYMRDEIP